MKKHNLSNYSRPTESGGNIVVKWSPLVAGQLKLNVDAPMIEGANFFLVDMVIRDNTGQFFRVKNMKIAGSVIVLEAEVVWVQEALIWLGEFPSQEVIIESDSLLVVNAVNRGSQ